MSSSLPEYIFSGFYFKLVFLGESGTADAAFQEVSGLSKEISTEEVTWGGENRFKYRLPTIPKYQNLLLKRGVTNSESGLRDWCNQTLDGGLGEPIQTKDLQLLLLNEQGVACMQWTVHKAYPVKWQTSELNSEKNALLIETIELSFQYFEAEVS